MGLTKETVLKVAELAHIEMPDDKLEQLLPDMNNIITWVEQLSELDTDNVEPLANISDETAPLREDVVNDGDIQDKVLKNAPSKREGFFEVLKIVE